MPDTFSLTSDAIPTDARVVTFSGSEELSRLYRFDVQLVMSCSASDEFDLASAVGAPATLSMLDPGGSARMTFHGVLTQVEFVCDLSGDAIYRAELVPRFWRLTQSLHSRVYVGKTVTEILQAALTHGGLSSTDFELRLGRSYHPMEHVCQYRESDFDFVSRWMEREGIYYFFEHGDAQEKLIITDSLSYQAPFSSEPVRYFAQGGADGGAVEALHAFTCRHRALPARVHVRDYDYQRPDTPVSSDASVSGGTGEVHLFGENFTDANEARRLAGVRAQEMAARQVVYEGRGRGVAFRPGYTFPLEDHSRSAFNRAYLVTAVEHRGNQFAGANAAEVRRALGSIGVDGVENGDQTYGVRVRAIADDVQFRPARTTPWPRIYGTEIGVIDGPIASDHAQIDADGRYLVKVLFDESDLHDGTASMRLRMLQPHGGNPEGFHFPLRKGAEVMLTFLGGDPDRPVIVGVVPNASNPSPVTQDNHMLNVIHTGGNNRIEISDIPGKEYLKFRTPHGRTVFHIGARHNPSAEKYSATDGSSKSIVGMDQVAFVGHSRCAVIGEAAENADGTGSNLPVPLQKFRDDVLNKFRENPLGTDKFIPNPKFDPTKPEDPITNPSMIANPALDNNNSTSTGTDAEGANQNKDGTTFDITETPVKPYSDIKIVGMDYWSKLGGDRDAEVLGNQRTHVAGNVTSRVDGNQHSHVKGNVHTVVDGNQNSHVKGHVQSKIDLTQHTHVVGHVTSQIDGGQTSTITGGQTSSVSGGQHITVDTKTSSVGAQNSNVGAQNSFIGASSSFIGARATVVGLNLAETIASVTNTNLAISAVALQIGYISTQMNTVALQINTVLAHVQQKVTNVEVSADNVHFSLAHCFI